MVCELQKTYGKTQAELKTLVKGFCWVLSGHSMQQILDAIKTYILKHNDIPAPADLETIINPPAEPLSAAVYTRIIKKIKDDSVYVTPTERDYVRQFEAQELAKVKK